MVPPSCCRRCCALPACTIVHPRAYATALEHDPFRSKRIVLDIFVFRLSENHLHFTGSCAGGSCRMALPSLDACDGFAAGGRCACVGREVRPDEVRPEVGSPGRWPDCLPAWPTVSNEGETKLAAAALPR